MTLELELTLASVPVVFDAERSVYLPSIGSLLVADIHFGKECSLQNQGVSVPISTSRSDCERLDRLVKKYRPQKVIILGDLFHNRFSQHEEILGAFGELITGNSSTDWMLVRGNHDCSSGDPPLSLGLDCTDEPHEEDGITFRHIACEHDQGLSFSGHLHPVVSVRVGGRSRERCRCFVLKSNQVILPAFGDLTGGALVRKEAGTQLIAVQNGLLCEQ